MVICFNVSTSTLILSYRNDVSNILLYHNRGRENDCGFDWVLSVDHIKCHLRYRYSITVNQIMMASAKLEDMNPFLPLWNIGINRLSALSLDKRIIYFFIKDSILSFDTSTKFEVVYCCICFISRWNKNTTF